MQIFLSGFAIHLQLWAVLMKIARFASGCAISMSPEFRFRRANRLDKSQPHGRLLTANTGKIVSDLVLSLVLLIVIAPAMIAISGLVALDGGPVLYKHLRIGRGGKRFYCLKFRSMVLDADRILAERLASDPAAQAEWVARQKLKHDPRVTAIGRFLRATSLDELPQLFNVLKLEMSLVGPRPIVENELARYGRHISYYLKARPGVTGLWQVSGRSNTSYSRRVALDAWYVKNWRFSRDIGILLRTVFVVVRRDGAH